MLKNKFIYLFLFISILWNGCDSQTLPFQKMTDFGNFRYSIQDTLVVKDLIKTCPSKLSEISIALQLKLNYIPEIEIYPNQAEYDKYIMNREFRGSPAVSGNSRIQMVSPLGIIKIDSIPYSERLLFLVHEYVHLLIDQLESPPPVFLDEGLACYYGSYNFYNEIITKHSDQINFIPTLEQLQNHYDEVPAADLFSYLFIDYLINSEKCDPFSDIIRNPDMLLNRNQAWIDYMKAKFH
jgi:hypothetical protein